MPRRVVVVHLWQIAVAFIAITLAFVVAAGWLTHQQREIQRQRVTSCKHTYEGVREIFRPFFRPCTDSHGEGTPRHPQVQSHHRPAERPLRQTDHYEGNTVNTPDHIVVILAALIVTLAGYCILVVVSGDNPKFLEGAVVGLAGAIAGFAGKGINK
jgi:hypothetical protein